MTQPSWLPLATLAIQRLERLAADDQPSQWSSASAHSPEPWEVHEPGRKKGFSPTAALARVPSAVLAPCDEGEALARGEEVYTPPGDEVVRQPDIPQPKVLPPLDRLVLALRLSVLFGRVSAVRAILRSGAVTVLAHGDVPEGDVRHVLDEALLPDGRTTTVSWATKSVAAGDLATLSLGTVEMARRAVRDGSITTLLGQGRAVLILVPHPHDLPDDLKRILPQARLLPPLDREILSVLLGVTHSASAGKLDVVARLPDDPVLARLGDAGLLLALRAPTAGVVAERVTALLKVPSDPARPTLERFEGYGAAEAVARQMVADLLAWQEGEVPWSEVQRSVLFFGEPGTGKSFLALAMAGSAGVALVRGGFAAWQAAGHLGLMLAAMRKTFAEARLAAPAILVIDEIDAVGSRESPDPHNENYRRQVINAFLEELDGLVRMPGVLVVGTCNHPGTIDPAVLRPGRFDMKVEVPTPGCRAIARMLQDALPGNGFASDAAVMAQLIRAASGQTAAAIDAALRAARAGARSERRALRPDDVLRALAGDARQPHVERRVALHECGHAIIATALGLGQVTRLVLRSGSGEAWTRPASHEGLLGDWEAELTRLLAGRAAERLVLGSVSSGAGGAMGSDLSLATRLAVQIDTRMGLGAEGPLWHAADPALYLANPANALRVRERLEAAEERARTLLARDRPLLNAMADALVEVGLMDGNDLAQWLAKVERSP
ncbi:AAA family ATPase [Paracoccus actinidiae]|uniref:AAA family ATPase n=1 Tax=Paracoccus actinidiae TaxID=3064531 RepID=UPI0027D2444E|nr:AAA family ATPase [Paracoccus sp. M09]